MPLRGEGAKTCRLLTSPPICRHAIPRPPIATDCRHRFLFSYWIATGRRPNTFAIHFAPGNTAHPPCARLDTTALMSCRDNALDAACALLRSATKSTRILLRWSLPASLTKPTALDRDTPRSEGAFSKQAFHDGLRKVSRPASP